MNRIRTHIKYIKFIPLNAGQKHDLMSTCSGLTLINYHPTLTTLTYPDIMSDVLITIEMNNN